jgi:hypothetical protein
LGCYWQEVASIGGYWQVLAGLRSEMARKYDHCFAWNMGFGQASPFCYFGLTLPLPAGRLLSSVLTGNKRSDLIAPTSAKLNLKSLWPSLPRKAGAASMLTAKRYAWERRNLTSFVAN